MNGRNIYLLAFLLLSHWSSCFADQKPNILFIYIDDLGWKDAGFMGSDFYETPAIDELSKGGMVFTDAYSCAANCAPARACLLSGQYTPRHGIYNVGTKPRGNAKHRRLIHVPGKGVLDPQITTWAEVLQSAGYRTGMFGKWHLGPSPDSQGFDVSVDHKLPGFKGHYGPNGEYLADVLTQHSIDFITENRESPWCVYLSHFAVHTPLQPKKELVEKFESKPAGKLHSHVAMATMIQAVDDGIARLLSLLDELELRDNTVIVFYSDNGGYGPATDMDPLKGYKGTYFEGGIRVPLLINWPGSIKPGSTCSEPVIGVDFFPTLCEIAGASLPEQPLDGLSVMPLLRGDTESFKERPIFWHFPAYLQSYSIKDEQRDPLFRSRPVSVIRLGDYKLIEYFEDGHLSLYNLRDDLSEASDLAVSHQEKRDELYQILKAWRKEIGAPVPDQPNPKFNPAAEAKAIHKALAAMDSR